MGACSCFVFFILFCYFFHCCCSLSVIFSVSLGMLMNLARICEMLLWIHDEFPVMLRCDLFCFVLLRWCTRCFMYERTRKSLVYCSISSSDGIDANIMCCTNQVDGNVKTITEPWSIMQVAWTSLWGKREERTKVWGHDSTNLWMNACVNKYMHSNANSRTQLCDYESVTNWNKL